MKINPIKDPRLIEMDFGSWEGINYSKIINQHSLQFSNWDKNPINFRPPRGESVQEVLFRVSELLNNIKKKHKKENIILVSHKTLCRLLISYVLGLNPAEFRKRLSQNSAAINIIQYYKRGWRLILLNDISHLNIHHTEQTSLEDDF